MFYVDCILKVERKNLANLMHGFTPPNEKPLEKQEMMMAHRWPCW